MIRLDHAAGGVLRSERRITTKRPRPHPRRLRTEAYHVCWYCKTIQQGKNRGPCKVCPTGTLVPLS